MRPETEKQAKAEIEQIDQIQARLEQAIRESYEAIRTQNPRIPGYRGDIEMGVSLHNQRLSQVNALEEIRRRGYGRVAFVTEIDGAGGPKKVSVFRVSQANANLPEASIVARNGRMGSAIVSCNPGEEFEVRVPGGERFFIATALIELEGTTDLLQHRPEIKLARFRVTDDPTVDVIRDVRSFVENLPARTVLPPPLQPAVEAEELPRELERFELYWPIDWSRVILADEPEAALGAQFFTRTTLQQEDAIKAVRGLTVVHGIAGTGKTSVALGRLKFFSNFRSGEHLEEHGLSTGDWIDFDSKDMIGFVLSPSLVQYLRQTAEDLELHMKIVDFEEFRNQERLSRRLFGRPFRRSPARNPSVQKTIRWLRSLAEVGSQIIADQVEVIQREALSKPDTPDGNRVSAARWNELENELWKAGPLRGRLTGIIRSLRRGEAFRLQGIANQLEGLSLRLRAYDG
jgi:hypothetical protein